MEQNISLLAPPDPDGTSAEAIGVSEAHSTPTEPVNPTAAIGESEISEPLQIAADHDSTDGATANPNQTDGWATERDSAPTTTAEPDGADGWATEREQNGGTVLRYAARTIAFFLGGFAVLMLTFTAVDGVSMLLERGIGALAIGEVFGGVADIETAPETHRTLETLPQSPSPPANEQEDSATETTPFPETPTDGAIGIISADLSAENGQAVINETPYEVTVSDESTRAIPALAELYATFGSDAPVVLILHSHGTETYAEQGASFTDETQFRNLNPDQNVLAVGKALAETLRSHGINVLLCEEMFDQEDYNMAYYNASLAIRRYLEQYPSISYIFDLHRDSISYNNGTETLRPVTTINGENCAQIMFVVGTDHGGADHGDWADNFNLACRIQTHCATAYPGLMRPINLRSASFNQQYTKGSLLLEMGAVGSSLEEACASARILGDAIAAEIIGATEA